MASSWGRSMATEPRWPLFLLASFYFPITTTSASQAGLPLQRSSRFLCQASSDQHARGCPLLCTHLPKDLDGWCIHPFGPRGRQRMMRGVGLREWRQRDRTASGTMFAIFQSHLLQSSKDGIRELCVLLLYAAVHANGCLLSPIGVRCNLQRSKSSVFSYHPIGPYSHTFQVKYAEAPQGHILPHSPAVQGIKNPPAVGGSVRFTKLLDADLYHRLANGDCGVSVAAVTTRLVRIMGKIDGERTRSQHARLLICPGE